MKKAKEITIKNIEGCRYRVGKSVKGKGIEIFKADERVVNLWAEPSNPKSIQQVKRAMEKYNWEQVYVTSIYFYDKGEKKHLQFKDAKASQKQFNVKELFNSKFKNITKIAIYATFYEKIGYFPISKYSVTLESQKEMIKDFLKFVGYNLYDNKLQDYLYEPEYFDDMITFRDDWNGDYHLIYGEGTCQYINDSEYFNGKMDYINNAVLDEFWQNIDELENYLNEIDSKNEISVYTRKGKDWYIGYNYEQEDIIISYLDIDGEESEETFWGYMYKENQELVDKIYNILSKEKKTLRIKSYLYNEMRISGYYDDYNDWSYNDNIFNLNIIDKEFRNRCDAAGVIEEYIDWNDDNDTKIIVADAYENWLKNDFEDDILLGKYKHLKMLKKIAKEDGKEVVYTRMGYFTDEKSYAIKYKNEEYHFTLGELLLEAPQKFYSKASKNLSKRLLEKYKQTLLVQKAKRVFVGLEDSYKSGNCKAGTLSWAKKHNIDTSKIGGIRGDEILKIDYSNFTKRAVLEALAKHEGIK